MYLVRLEATSLSELLLILSPLLILLFRGMRRRKKTLFDSKIRRQKKYNREEEKILMNLVKMFFARLFCHRILLESFTVGCILTLYGYYDD